MLKHRYSIYIYIYTFFYVNIHVIRVITHVFRWAIIISPAMESDGIIWDQSSPALGSWPPTWHGKCGPRRRVSGALLRHWKSKFACN